MEVQEGKQAVFIHTSDEKNSGIARFINDKDKAVAANCRMKKVTDDQVEAIATSWQLARVSLVSLILFTRKTSFKDTTCQSYRGVVKKGV